MFDNEQFGMIVNDCEKYSDRMNEKIFTLFSPLLEQIGYPTLGIDFTYFIGNYGYTPIGYHIDPPGDSVIHLHLGPGPKKMFLLRTEAEKKEYHHKRNGDTTLYIDPIPFEKNAIEYHIEPGDLFYMPSGEIHVGKSDELSIGLTIWLRSGTVGTIYEKLMDRVLHKAVRRNHQMFFPFIQHPDDVSRLVRISNTATSPHDAVDLSHPLEKLMCHELNELQHEILSNGGLAIKPDIIVQEEEVDHQSNVAAISPYKMLYIRINDDLMKLFIRGHSIYAPYSVSFSNLLERLNQGKQYSVEQILAMLTDWDEETTRYVLQQMHKYQGISLQKKS